MHKNNAGNTALTILTLVVVAALVGCSEQSGDGTPAAGAKGGTLIIGVLQEPDLLNNILKLQKTGRLINNTLYSRFLIEDDQLRLQPDLVTEVPSIANGGISSDGLTYTYHLKKNAKWHDGEPLTSADVRFTYEMIMDPEAGAESQFGWGVVASLETPDAHTVVFRLKRPTPTFLNDTFTDEDVLPKHLLDGDRGARFPVASFHRAPVGSGPFRFEEWVPGSHITVRRFEGYHGDVAALDEIIFKFIPDGTGLGAQLRNGEISGCDNAPVSQLSVLEQIADVTVYRTPSLGYTQVTINCQQPILDDVNVRRALALAVDRDAIAEHVFDGIAEPAYSGNHPRTPFHHAAAREINAFALQRAGALLDDAGWLDSDGDGFRERNGKPLQFEITTSAGRPVRERLQAVLQDQWRALGVQVGLTKYEMRTLVKNLRQGQFDLALFGWTQSADPGGIADLYGTAGAQNFGNFSNTQFDDWVQAGQAMLDPQNRAEIYRGIDKLLCEQSPTIPLVWNQEIDAMPDALNNFKPHPSTVGDTWNAQHWWLER